jgi:hypothetical protein
VPSICRRAPSRMTRRIDGSGRRGRLLLETSPLDEPHCAIVARGNAAANDAAVLDGPTHPCMPAAAYAPT